MYKLSHMTIRNITRFLIAGLNHGLQFLFYFDLTCKPMSVPVILFFHELNLLVHQNENFRLVSAIYDGERCSLYIFVFSTENPFRVWQGSIRFLVLLSHFVSQYEATSFQELPPNTMKSCEKVEFCSSSSRPNQNLLSR